MNLADQWYPASFSVDGINYNCAEQYMMAGRKPDCLMTTTLFKKFLQKQTR